MYHFRSRLKTQLGPLLGSGFFYTFVQKLPLCCYTFVQKLFCSIQRHNPAAYILACSRLGFNGPRPADLISTAGLFSHLQKYTGFYPFYSTPLHLPCTPSAKQGTRSRRRIDGHKAQTMKNKTKKIQSTISLALLLNAETERSS